MTPHAEIKCAKCHSSNVIYYKERCYYVCQDCHSGFYLFETKKWESEGKAVFQREFDAYVAQLGKTKENGPMSAQDMKEVLQAFEKKDTQRASDSVLENVAESFDEEADLGFGIVIRVDGNDLILNKYDYVSDTHIEDVFSVTPVTEYGNIRGLKDFSPGDDVMMYFRAKGGKKIIIAINRDETSER